MTNELSRFLDRFLRKHAGEAHDILELTVDTSVSKASPGKIVPFLNLILGDIGEGDDFDEAVKKAVENDDIGFYGDIVDIADESYFEFELSSIKSEWEIGTDIDDDELFETLRLALAENAANTHRIAIVFFHYVDSLDFVFFKRP